MVLGGQCSERVILNEKSMWSGSPDANDREGGYLRLGDIRKLVFEERHAEAQALVNETFICANQGSGRGSGKDATYGCYQVFGELGIVFPCLGEPAVYQRELDLSTGMVSITMGTASESFSRQAFASAADDVIVYHIVSSSTGGLNFDVSLTREEAAASEVNDGCLTLHGGLGDGRSGVGVRFLGMVHFSHDGRSEERGEGGISVRNATVATLLVSMRVRRDFGSNEGADMRRSLERLAALGFEALRERHEADFRARFDRVQLHLPNRGSTVETPTRVELCGRGEVDPSLSSLYFHFGRYLLLSSSRETDALPANLQGIWAEEVQTPWNGDFHLNINVQMNYWPSEVANLAECHHPLLAFTEALAVHGENTARAYYDCGGWVAHMMTNPWYFTAPGEDASWGSSVTGGAWLCQHLWSHYEFSLDEGFLRRVYPVLRGSAEFFRDFLVEEPRSGWLVTCPSSSPENWFVNTRGERASVCAGPTMDTAIIRELFGNVVEAARILQCDEAFSKEIAAMSGRLPPYRIGRNGQLQEWLFDYEECEPQHRHFSHLYGLFPGRDIGSQDSSAITEAARTSLLLRGEESTGWSTAWKACCWARLGDGERAHAFVRKLTSPPAGVNGGGAPNLFCMHPPFQIDGNLGGTAAIAEMLLQSHERLPESGAYVVSLLPAVPPEWDYGSFSGLRVRGNLEVCARWKESTLTEISIKSPSERSLSIRYRSALSVVNLKVGLNFFRWDAQESILIPVLKNDG